MAEWTNESLKDDGRAIGEFAGGLDIFPLAELKRRQAERDAQEKMIEDAVDMAEMAGDDFADLDELAQILGDKAGDKPNG